MSRISAFLIALLAPLAAVHAQSNYATPYTFTTLAGHAPFGIADGLGGAAQFNAPRGIAVDGVGNVYVADSGNNTIRKITAAGVVTTLAGTPGVTGSADGIGGAAQFYFPAAVAVDGLGNVYVADSLNGTIRKITASGVVTTLAGTPGITGSADGTGNAAQFNYPTALAVDGVGNLLVVDSYNCTIRKISPSGVVTTLAGSPGSYGSNDGIGTAARFNAPNGVAVDGSGNIYVADSGNNTIRKITTAGAVTTLAGNLLTGSTDGTGSAARFNNPEGLAVDSLGNLYTADNANSTIRKISSGGVVTTVAGTAGIVGSADGTGGAAQFGNPNGLALDNAGNVYVADFDTIRKITPAGAVTTLAGAAFLPGTTDGPGNTARFNFPWGVALDGSGNLYVADTNNHSIRKISAAGTVTTFAGSPGIAGSADGVGSAALFNGPTGVAADGSGNLYVADGGNDTIRKITSTGVVTTLAGSAGKGGSTDGTGSAARFSIPQALAVDGLGNVYVADNFNTIRKITAVGVVTTLAGFAGSPPSISAGTGSTDGPGAVARFNRPRGVAVDGSGNVYVADTFNSTIRKISPAGVVTTFAGTAGSAGSTDGTGSAARFFNPHGMAVDAAGNVYVAEAGNSTIRKITPLGAVATLAGTPGINGSADGTGSVAAFNTLRSLTVDGLGNLYVADAGNNAIRKGTAASPAITSSLSASGSFGTAFSYTIAGSNSPSSFNATGLPAGLVANPGSGVISGTPTVAGTFAVTISATNASGTGSASLSVTITLLQPAITSTLSATGSFGAPFSYVITASNTPTSFNATGLPAGLSVDPTTGVISGTPTVVGTFTVTIGASNAGGTGSATLTVTINSPVPVITSALTATGSFGKAFSYAITGSNTPTSFNATGLPAGLSVDPSTGVISGNPTVTGTFNVIITVTNPGGSKSGILVLTLSTARLLNLSARANVGTGGNILIAGFVVSGSGNKSMLIRGVGPALGPFGISNYLVQPLLGLFNSQSVQFNSNAGWNNNAALGAAFTQVGAFAYPANSLDTALQVSLAANQYTAQVSGTNSGTGVALAELYDADPGVLSSPSRLVNISARASVGTAANILIAGFVIGGSGSETVLIRGIGPTLAGFGVTGVLANPVLTLYDSLGNVITSSQGWQNPPATPAGNWAGQAAPTSPTHTAFTGAGAFDLNNGTTDSAFVITLPAGAYTAQVSGFNGTSGVALVEIYEMP